MTEFRIKSVNINNYYGNNEKVTGSCTYVHEGSNVETSIKLSPEECGLIFAILSGNIARLAHEAAVNVLKSLADSGHKAALDLLPDNHPVRQALELEHLSDETADDIIELEGNSSEEGLRKQDATDVDEA